MSCNDMLYYFISCHVMSCHIISYHVMYNPIVFSPRSIISDDLVKVGDGDCVLGVGLVIGHTGVLEPVAPQDLIGQVGGAHLGEHDHDDDYDHDHVMMMNCVCEIPG